MDGSVLSGPDIITRGFIYVKDAEDLMEALRYVVNDTLEHCRAKHIKDHSAIKAAIRNDLSAYLFKVTKRKPMIIPVLTEL